MQLLGGKGFQVEAQSGSLSLRVSGLRDWRLIMALGGASRV